MFSGAFALTRVMPWLVVNIRRKKRRLSLNGPGKLRVPVELWPAPHCLAISAESQPAGNRAALATLKVVEDIWKSAVLGPNC